MAPSMVGNAGNSQPHDNMQPVLVMNYVMYRIGLGMFASQGLRVRRNVPGFLLYAFVYSLILQPASVAGHFSELLGLRKTWGSK